MAQFSRRTILAATDILAGRGNAGITRFLLEHELENAGVGYTIRDRTNAVAKHLLTNTDELNEDGVNIVDAAVSEIVNGSMGDCQKTGFVPAESWKVIREFDIEAFRERYPELERALARDSFTLEGGELRRMLPESLDLPKADDEVHLLLGQYGFQTAQGHLDLGIAAHARGEWASANAQFRVFIESLCDLIAGRLGCDAALPSGIQRKQYLANRSPPFFQPELNEWTGQGLGFLEGFFKRLHPGGAHPGLSDEEDSTFRLHLVLLVGRLLLRRVGQV